MAIPSEIANEIVDPKAYADGTRIDDALTWLRHNAPLEVANVDGFDPFWVVTRHADVQKVERDNERFHNGDRSVVLAPKEALQQVRQLTGGSPYMLRTLVHMDNPDHRNFRQLTQGWFMPVNLQDLELRIREIARRSVDRMGEFDGRCDFARDVALKFPLHVIMDILGIPEEDEPRMLQLTQELFGNADPELNRSGKKLAISDSLASVRAVVADFMAYFTAITEDRRRAPRKDLATVIATGQIAGNDIAHLEAMSYYIITATAGHDTTSSTIASALWAMAERPEEFARLKSNPTLIRNFVDESIRWATAVKHFMRSATADTEIAGRKIAKGDWLMLAYQSGNRDEDVFDDPFAFQIDRSPNRHLAFGFGAHNCLGQHLAKMEMRILWEELLKRLDKVELADEPRRAEATFVCGPKTVPIRFKFH